MKKIIDWFTADWDSYQYDDPIKFNLYDLINGFKEFLVLLTGFVLIIFGIPLFFD